MAGVIDQIIPVTITATNAQPQVPNFGTPAIVGYHTYNLDAIRSYFNLQGMLDDGFVESEPLYLMASAMLSQSPSVSSFFVVRNSSAIAYAATFLVTDNNVGDNVGFTLMTAYQANEVDLKITTTGVLGTMAFDYALNGGSYTGSPITSSVAPYSFLIPNTGVTINFSNINYTSTNWRYVVAKDGTISASGGSSAGQISQTTNRNLIQDIKHVVTTGQTTAQIATALAALTPDGVTLGVATSTTVTVTGNVNGNIFYPIVNPSTGAPATLGGTWADTTATASPGTALDAAVIVNPNFYGVATEHLDINNIEALSTWATANKRMMAATTADTNNGTASTGVAYQLKVLGSTYAYTQYSAQPSYYGALALMSQRFTADPGTDTWAYKTLQEVPIDTLTSTQITNFGSEEANGNRCNYYISIAGVSVTRFGITAGGLYADLRRGIDALTAQIQINVFALLSSSPKVPFDPRGIAAVGGEVSAALQQFTATASQPANLLRGDPGFAPVVLLPNIANTTPVDRGNRVLKTIQFVAYAQNAIQVVKIVGTVNT